MRPRPWLAAALVTWVMASPSTALAASEWTEGPADIRPFSVESTSGTYVGTVREQPGVTLDRQKLWEYREPEAPSLFDPFSVTVLPNGNVLTASRNSNSVLEVTRAKRIVWSFTRVVDFPDFINVYYAQRLENGNTLITDRRLDRVLEVTPAKQIVWQYGHTLNDGEPYSYAPGSLVDTSRERQHPDR